MRVSKLVKATLALGVALTGAVAVNGPARAVGDIDAVSLSSPNNSVSVKAQTVPCPGNTVAYGGMVSIDGGFGNVSLARITPAADLRSVTVAAIEDDAYADSWRVIARAMCGTASPGQDVFDGESAFNSNTSKEAQAECPGTLQLLGAGADLDFGAGDVFITAIIPDPATDTVTVRATEDQAFADSWGIRAYAICAQVPAASTVPITDVSTFDSNSPKQASETCPTGRFVHGVGFELSGQAGDIVIDDMATVGGSELASTAFAYENGADAGNWEVRTHGICST